MKRSVFIVAICILSSQSFAQDFLQDLTLIRQKYFQPEGEIKFNLRMQFYDVKNLEQVEDSSFGTFRLSKNLTYADFENTISITNDSFLFLLDKTGRRIFISKNIGGLNTYAYSPLIIDSLARKLNLKISALNSSSKGLRKFRIHVPEGEVDSADIEYSPTNYLMKSITVYYRRSIDPDEEVKPVAKIIYENQVLSSNKNLTHYDIGKYVVINNKAVTLKEPYSSYRLINNLIF